MRSESKNLLDQNALDRLNELETEYADVVGSLSDPTVISDTDRLRIISRRHKELDLVIKAYREYCSAVDDVSAAKELFADNVGTERELARSEIEQAENSVERLEAQLRALLLPRDPNDGKRVIVEVAGAEGGEEARLFAKDLFDMYMHFAERKKWKFEMLGSVPSERGGFDKVSFMVEGDEAWARMKHEGGPHRVQRVPVTESQGRIHTSSATVTVLPEADPLEVQIDDKDLKIDIYRSTGPGGQSVNTTDSAVRITHLPSGIVVAMQDERSQIQNRARAMQVLAARLLAYEKDRLAAERSAERRSQVGGGGRSEKIRTYNFKDNRVTDHRIGMTVHKLDRVLMGELDEISDALLADERSRQLATGGS
ncbi:MAG TPA: peptide chain release factor 1 [Acidimicrobiales bacterium]|nr:peptide chain release factor 1 [Acidimicrobiales bacterium]